MPGFFPQKASKSSKAKDNLQELEGRMKLCGGGNIDDLFILRSDYLNNVHVYTLEIRWSSNYP